MLVVRAGRDEVAFPAPIDRLLAALPAQPQVLNLNRRGHNTNDAHPAFWPEMLSPSVLTGQGLRISRPRETHRRALILADRKGRTSNQLCRYDHRVVPCPRTAHGVVVKAVNTFHPEAAIA